MSHPATGHPQPDAGSLEPAAALVLLRLLKTVGYRFVTPTPTTHGQVLRRAGKQRARDLRDILGWSLPFTANAAPPEVLAAMESAGVVRETPDGLRATVRVSTLGEDLFLHSAFPPTAKDAVFFGPDTYRFARLLNHVLADDRPLGRVIDVGTGSGAGAVVAAKAGRAGEVVATDINPQALMMARVNLAAAEIEADTCLGSGLSGVSGTADLIVANPPFIAGTDRIYRGGGDMLGARLSYDWTLEGAARLNPQGRFVLYTGSAIVEGRDGLREALRDALDPALYDFAYEELDPDIFGDQLSATAYDDVERIAAVSAVIRRR